MTPTDSDHRSELLKPYVPRLLIEWLRETPGARWKAVEGSLAFVDISGFTKMTERLAKKGKVGAEELNDILSVVFTELLSVAYDYGAGLVKWGGDAVLLLFEGEEHAARAARASAGMQRTLRAIGRITSSAGVATLRMSVGIHSGEFHFFLVGGRHRELVITGPAATRTVAMESAAEAGDVLLSPEAAALLDPANIGAPKEDGLLLKGEPAVQVERARPAPDVAGLDLYSCLPETIREHLLADAEDAEHRPIATAFIEFRETDAMLEREGPDALAEALDELMVAVQSAVHDHEVVFSETDISANGGKILLIAGAPASAGDDEERMLRTARAVIEQEFWLPIRIGVNCGRVFTGDFGPPYRRTYSCKGDALNTAARIMGKAEPGQALATEDVLNRSRTTFELTPVGPFVLKGKAQPLPAFALGPVISRETRERHELPLIGREHEMSVLLEALASARQGVGRLVELIGEPGIGKSRLVEELRREAGEIELVVAACEQYESSTPYHPFRGAMRSLLGLRADERPARVEQRLRRRVEELAPELAPWLPLLGPLLDVELPATPEVDRLEDRFRRAKLEEATGELLARLLSDTTLLVFEDVHWMDEASAALLLHLAGSVGRRPWLLIASRRDMDTGFVAPQIPEASALRPAPLGEQAALALVEAETEEQPLPPHVVATLTERAGGNPLFLAELVSAARTLGPEALPDSVEALLAAQIDRLEPRDRRVLRYASVLGTSFPQDLLRASLEGQEHALDDGVWSRLAGFVQRDRSGIARFRHALVRDAAYEGLPFKRRLELHGHVGETIERLAGSDPNEQAGLLSLHFLNAHRYEKAWQYARVAGEHARAVYANAEAAELFERALQAARRLGSVPDADLATVWEALGDAHDFVGQPREGAVAYRAARRLRAGDPLAEASLCLKEAFMVDRLGNYPQALRWIRRGLDALDGDERSEISAKRAELQVFYGAVRQGQGRSAEAIRWCESAIAEAERAGAKKPLAYAYCILDWAYIASGRPERAVYSTPALALYEELGDLHGQALVLNNLGGFAYFDGRWDDALALYQRALEARELLGDVGNVASITYNIAEVLLERGQLEEAEVLIRRSLRVRRALSDRLEIAESVRMLGRAASRSGRAAEAVELLREARDEFAALGAHGEVAETNARLAASLVRSGHSEEGLRLASDALAGAVGPTVPMLERIQGYGLAQRGDFDGALEAMEASLASATSQGLGFEEACTLEAIVNLGDLLGRPTDDEHRERRDELLASLGIVRIPSFPLPEAPREATAV
ncbi:MAG: adenylate/guanylate cyclase domain-containing protein [Gaiellales bacterium]